jgi:hypothetical protein
MSANCFRIKGREAIKVAAAPVAMAPVVAPVPDPVSAPEKPALIPVQLLTASID